MCWLETCYEYEEVRNANECFLYRPHFIPKNLSQLFKGCVVTASQYSKMKKDHIFHFAEALGMYPLSLVNSFFRHGLDHQMEWLARLAMPPWWFSNSQSWNKETINSYMNHTKCSEMQMPVNLTSCCIFIRVIFDQEAYCQRCSKLLTFYVVSPWFN